MSTQMPQDMKAFNRKLIEEFRANGGKLSGPMEGRQLMLLTTKGAKSGQRRTVVLGYRPYGEAYAAIASDNGAAKDPKWFENLMADPTATVEVGAERFEARARVAAADEREDIGRRIEYLAPQQARTEREIPIVVFERL
jgi:deazaflavin-dependent oxidoreductase (nitroreductase family)